MSFKIHRDKRNGRHFHITSLQLVYRNRMSSCFFKGNPSYLTVTKNIRYTLLVLYRTSFICFRFPDNTPFASGLYIQMVNYR